MEEWSEEQLEWFVNEKKDGFIYLYTPLCGTCKLAEKMLVVTNEILPDVTKGKININYMSKWAESWRIESVPCLLIFKEGSLADKIYAFRSVPYLIDKINNYMKQ
ncbi:thioredoxin family protein [Bacillus sp. 03113]|uniref:thioredoxin family protein n=1 Tax=Bacillus sp. 03113 TaxID=2578211 RepID=UPI001141EF3A|nr:thioredoxin family protein [Bacillus sp. 03113]